MCGITGKLVLADSGRVSEDLLRQMTNSLRHRGPDDEGIYVEGPVGLGHRRLSIIDLDGGHQPMFSADRKKVIVFNGEIYNYRILREILRKKGHTFRTDSDTEVILAAYEEYGEESVSHLRGMFSFAIWDAEQRVLFLARDRLGIKPLYYYWDGRVFSFGSEIKAILQDPNVDRTLDLSALDDYLTFLYIPSPKSVFKHIRKLRPGHTLKVSLCGPSEREYWDVKFTSDAAFSEADYKERLLGVIRDSVKAHLVSDVPLGAFLSGGLDSSAIVGIMSSLVDGQISTASIGFSDNHHNELAYARLVAEEFQTDAWEKNVEPSAAHILEELVWHFDEPFGDSSMVPTYYVSQVAREKVKVCLSGDGGDENFAGYRRYRFDVLENRIRGVLPSWARRPLFGLLGRVVPKADWLPRMFRAETLFTNLSEDSEVAYCRTMSWFTDSMKNELYAAPLRDELAGYDPYCIMQSHFERVRHLDPLARIQYVDLKTYLPDDILTKVDRASMAHSLEVRVPLLDHQVVEYAAGIPSSFKLRGGEGKYIFKKAVEDIVPPEILRRKKMGFSMPVAQWFRGELRPVFEQVVLTDGAFIDDYFEKDTIRRWWSQHQRRTRDYSWHLWALLVLEYWGRKFVRRGPVSSLAPVLQSERRG